MSDKIEPEARQRKMFPTGFTLLELSVVLVIIGTILGGGLVIFMGSLDAGRVNMTVERMDRIHKALLDYTVAFGRLPCPANLALATTDTNYGVEAASNSNTCIGGTPAASFSSSSGTVEGTIPVRTLRLPYDLMYDAWGRKFRYAMNPAKSASSSFPPSSGTPCSNTKNITVKDATGANRTTSAVYMLMSHGADGHGGYTRNGAVFSSGATNTDEQTNCHCSSANPPVANTYTATYVAKLPTVNSSTATDTFDDIVSFRDAWQLQSPNQALTASSCGYVYVLDRPNSYIKKFDMSGNLLATISMWSSEYMDVNSSGEIFIQNFANGWVEKYSALGVFSNNIGSGSLNGTEGVTVDRNDNLWVADAGNNRIVKYSISGATATQLQVIPSDCTTSCSASNANGRFNYPLYIAVDAAGNIYVQEYSCSRVQKFNSSGVFQTGFGAGYNGVSGSVCGTGALAGQINQNDPIAVDSNNNLWVSDGVNNRVMKFNSSGVYQSQFPCASGACATSSAAGWFNGNYAIRIDSGDNIWVSDENNQRVQKFDTNGSVQLQFPCASGACGAGGGLYPGSGLAVGGGGR